MPDCNRLVDNRIDIRTTCVYPCAEIVSLSGLIACNAMNWPGGAALCPESNNVN